MELLRQLVNVIERHVKALGIVLTVLSFLFMLHYAQHAGIPLRIHSAQVAGLLPWVFAAMLLVIIVLLSALAVVAFIADLKIQPHGPSLRELLVLARSMRAKNRAFMLWWWMVGFPLTLAELSLIGLAALGTEIDWKFAFATFVAPTVLGITTTSWRLRQLGYNKRSMLFWAGYVAVITVSVMITAVYLLVFGSAGLDHAGVKDDASVIAGMVGVAIALVVIVFVVFHLVVRPPEPAHARAVVVGAVLITALLSILPGPASFFMSLGLSYMKLGALPMRYAVVTASVVQAKGDQLVPDVSTHAPTVQWTVPVRLLLDEGDQLRVRLCSEKRGSTRSLLIPKNALRGQDQVSKQECVDAAKIAVQQPVPAG